MTVNTCLVNLFADTSVWYYVHMNQKEKAGINPSIVSMLLSLLAIYVAGGTVFYHFVERWQWVDSLYFTVVTLATIGYGDFTPHTTAGKLFTIPYVFLGIGFFIAVANALLRNRTRIALENRPKIQAKVKNGVRKNK